MFIFCPSTSQIRNLAGSTTPPKKIFRKQRFSGCDVCGLIACTREGGRVPCLIYKTLVPRTPPRLHDRPTCPLLPLPALVGRASIWSYLILADQANRIEIGILLRCAVRVEHRTEPYCTTGRRGCSRTVPDQVNNIPILSGHDSLPIPVDRAVRSCEGGVGPHGGLRHSSDRSRKVKG